MSGLIGDYDFILCGVDNNEANVEVASYAFASSVPVVFVNVSRDGEAFRIFVQRPGEACFGCYNPRAVELRRDIENGVEKLACTPDPAIGDVLMAAVAFACRALTLEACGQRISNKWNCRDVTFYGLDVKEQVSRRPVCPVCGNESKRHSDQRAVHVA